MSSYFTNIPTSQVLEASFCSGDGTRYRNWIKGWQAEELGSIPGTGSNFLFFRRCRMSLGPSDKRGQIFLALKDPAREADH